MVMVTLTLPECMGIIIRPGKHTGMRYPGHVINNTNKALELSTEFSG